MFGIKATNRQCGAHPLNRAGASLRGFHAVVLAAATAWQITTMSTAAQAQTGGSMSVATCETGLERSAELNAIQLFGAYGDCLNQGRAADATLLLIMGQVRSRTDLALLRPETDQDRVRTRQLQQILFYRLGGAGDASIYRDRAKADALFARISAWTPEFSDDYSPGWSFKPSQRHALYADVAREMIDRRLGQLREYAALASDPRYAAAEAELDQITRETGGQLVHGTEAFDRAMALRKRMSEIQKEIKGTLPPVATGSILDKSPPELDEGVAQVATGFNGPPKQTINVFLTEDQVRESWLARALSETALNAVVGATEFGKEMVVVMAFGQRNNATGAVHVADIRYNATTGSFGVAAKVGVNETGCDQADAASYPFVVATAPVPTGPVRGSGRSLSNFGDGCKPPVSGAPTTN